MITAEQLRKPKNLAVGLGVLLLAMSLAGVSTRFAGVQGWLSFLVVVALGAGVLWGGWRGIRREDPPNWLAKLVVGAALLRLALGVFWLLALPVWGYDTPVQQGGYVMEDAFNRDAAAWRLAQSETPLIEAFQGYSAYDQFGGLLFLSAGVYRYLGANFHQPLLMLVLAAVFSALAVTFTWAFAKRAWGEQTAWLAAWLLAVYPEAALMGSTQMREAWMVSLAAMALYGLLRWWDQRNWANAAWGLLPVLIGLPLSTAFTGMLVGMLAVAAMALDEWELLRKKRFWLGIGILAAAGLAVILTVAEGSELWIVQTTKWQARLSEGASGWVQRTFEKMPADLAWTQLPFLLIYGVFRPLLPAALIAGGKPLWWGVAVWRAAGWTVILTLLLYATFLAVRGRQRKELAGGLLVVTWVVILLASLRGGGDMWDNPRYRAALAGVQAALAAWAVIQQRESKDPWLKRAFVSALVMMAWFVPWYLRRYTEFLWPVVELSQTVGLGLVSAGLYILWDWIGEIRELAS
ncbi:MAG: glycosyltransferase family 39 protein [Anaerolineae bacterium]|nr:glycosyltransferase family 39 protein [Anaerolineae bacterium]